MTEKVSKNISILTLGEKSENITVTACCNAAGKFPPTVLLSKGVNEKEDFGDGVISRSDVHMNCKSAYIGKNSFTKRSAKYVLKHVASAKVILLLDGHRAQCSSALLLQTAVKNSDNFIHLGSHLTRTLHSSDKCFLNILRVI
jgi:hypothetical protein